ncbi:hypothetical protein C8R43DRAFT_657570 [Mycena crocata]|nr:hypothetical protein C8R43DRAFT_657570 [Mycena crocata]
MQLPQELLDLIVEEIPDDLSTFKACSLTSRAFVTSARARLFHTVRLLPPSRYPTAKETTPCQKFYKLLSSCPHLAVLVKDLRIVEGNDRDQEWQGLDNSGARWISKASRTLSLILPLLHLERFCFQAKPKLDWETLSRSLKSALKDLFAAPQLRVLVLRGIVIKTPQNLISMITEGNGLRSLALSYIMARRRVPELSIPSGWQPRLQSLAFSDHYTSARFARALMASNIDFSHLRSLSLSGLNNPEIRALLEAFPPTNIVDTLRIWCPLCMALLHTYSLY